MLLCDFHIHTTYSDGVLPLPKVVDLFGQTGHDVIAITDHIVNRDNSLGKIASAGARVAAGALLALRWGMEVCASARAGASPSWRDVALLPLRDLGAAAVFWAGLVGRAVAWRGRPLAIGKETRILRTAA